MHRFELDSSWFLSGNCCIKKIRASQKEGSKLTCNDDENKNIKEPDDSNLEHRLFLQNLKKNTIEPKLWSSYRTKPYSISKEAVLGAD